MPPPSPSAARPPRRVHAVRFYSPPPTAAHCLAASTARTLLALSRADNSVEIWDVGRVPFLQRKIFLSGGSVEALCWAGERLFSAGFHGFVAELDLERLTERPRSPATSGPVWCLSYNEKRNRLAAGTEEGFVCLFEVTKDDDRGLKYDKVLDKQEGRVLCLAWHSSGNVIVTGSPDTIRVWDVDSGLPTARMSTGRAENLRETIVWAVTITDDFIVISGDSRGKTCFWDGRVGTLIDAFQTHRADVLAVALAPSDQRTAYSTGVDPCLMTFQQVEKKKELGDGERCVRKWVKSVHRTIHTHDVRAVAASGSKLYSAGVDADLVVNDTAVKSVDKHAPLSHGKNGSSALVAAESSLLLLRYPTHLEIWRLGEAADPTPDQQQQQAGSILPLRKEPVKLLEVQTKGSEPICACAISADGKFLAFATPSRLRAFTLLTRDEEKPSIKRCLVKGESSKSLFRHLVFCDLEADDARWTLVAVTDRGAIQFFSLDVGSNSFSLVESVPRKRLTGLSGGIAFVETHPDYGIAALADYRGSVLSFDLRQKKVLAQMSHYRRASLTCLAIDRSRDTLLLAYSDQRLVECELKTGRHTAFSSAINMPGAWYNRRFCVAGMLAEEDRILAYDDVSISVIYRQISNFKRSPSRKKYPKKSGETTREEETKVTIIKKYEHLAFLDKMANGNLVAVEVKPLALQEQLPPSLKQKKFGAG